ncbi:MAG: hypothetical protein KZQ73_08180 [Candidatus Thiodiazotropha sp. (ex Semelilucina semeliformis)]|nr:hypothetical protein [Candidatus Thiodiazotropha sp. (ex Semelilucina semeliformis)]
MKTKQRVTTKEYFGIEIDQSSQITREQYEETLKQTRLDFLIEAATFQKAWERGMTVILTTDIGYSRH